MAVKAMEGLTFGADPELFIMDSKGRYIPACEFIPGDKENPHKVDYGAVQVDGVAAEFNIDPVTTFKEWRRNIKAVTAQLEGFLPPGHRLVAHPTAEFLPEIWDQVPEEAKVLGCEPDFNAWDATTTPPPVEIQFTRCAGGHLHVGWTQDADPTDIAFATSCLDLVKQFDWYLAAWSVKLDRDKVRRQMYGKAGAMRFKPYGVEYRTLSNFWLVNDDRIEAVWDRMQTAIHDMRDNFIPNNKIGQILSSRMRRSVDTCVMNREVSSEFRFPVRQLVRY